MLIGKKKKVFTWKQQWNNSHFPSSDLCACSVKSDSLQPHGLTVGHQALLSMGFSRQGYWNGLPCPPPGDLPGPGIASFASPAVAGGFFTTSHLGSPVKIFIPRLLKKNFFLGPRHRWVRSIVTLFTRIWGGVSYRNIHWYLVIIFCLFVYLVEKREGRFLSLSLSLVVCGPIAMATEAPLAALVVMTL